MPTPRGGSRPVQISQPKLHQLIRRDIRHYCDARVSTLDHARTAANKLLQLDHQNEMVQDVADTCDRIGKLLAQLESETQLDEAVEVAEHFSAKVDPVGDGQDEVRALRVFASDDTTMETSSVADYAADPPAPPGYSSSCVQECVGGVDASSRKVCDSIEVLQKLIDDNPQWWNSAIVIRRLKTHAIRSNFHMRKVRRWADQARSHVFVGNSILTRSAQEATEELREMREQLKVVERRKSLCEQKRLELEAAARRADTDLNALAKENQILDTMLRKRVFEQHGVDLDDPPLCEAILLLSTLKEDSGNVGAAACSLQQFLVTGAVSLASVA